MEEKICESCGMPMKEISEYGGGNPENKYCCFCTDKDGNLKSYDEKVKDTTRLIMRTNDFGEQQATKMAKEKMKQFPAWEKY